MKIFVVFCDFVWVCQRLSVPLRRIKKEIAISEMAIANLYTYDCLRYEAPIKRYWSILVGAALKGFLDCHSPIQTLCDLSLWSVHARYVGSGAAGVECMVYGVKAWIQGGLTAFFCFFITKIRFVTLATKIFKNNSKMILVVDVAMLHLPWLVYL